MPVPGNIQEVAETVDWPALIKSVLLVRPV